MTATTRSHILENGLAVHLSVVPGEPLVALSASVGAGLLTERGHPAGVSHFVEHLVFKGDGRFTADDLVDEISACGGSLNAYTFYDNTAYEVSAPSGDLGPPLSVLARLLFRPAFPAHEVETERKVVLEEIARGLDAPDDLLFDLQAARFYGDDHPYGRSILGTASSIGAVTAGEVRAYHRARYAPGNIHLAIAGGFDPDEALELARRHFGAEPPGEVPPVAPADLAPRRPPGGTTRHPYRDAECGYGLAGWPAPSAGHPDAAAMAVAAALLGFGENSFLNRRLSLELGIAPSVETIAAPRRGPAQLQVAFLYEPGDEEKILAEIRAQVERLARADFSGEAFRSTVTRLEADHVFGLEQCYVRADGLALSATIDRPERFLDAVEILHGVTPEGVARAAAAWLSGEPVVCLVEPARRGGRARSGKGRGA